MRGVHRFAVIRRSLVLALFPLALAGPATSSLADEPEALAVFEEASDPIENVNRGTFEFNRGLDSALLKPVAEGYRAVVPEFGRQRVRNVLDNLKSPVVFVNDVLQAKPDRAAVTLGRFIVNSSVGLAGIFDVAAGAGYEGHDEDFGQTLAVWGVEEGPYLMIPMLGPSSARDGIGMLVDALLDPFNYIFPVAGSVTRAGVAGVGRREEVLDSLDDVERTSIDFYAAIRSLYRQQRADEIRDGELPPLSPIPDFAEHEVVPAEDEPLPDWLLELFEEVVALLLAPPRSSWPPPR